MTQIVTGDAVLLDLRPARIPTRMLATLVDLLVLGAFAYGWFYLVDAVGGSDARRALVQSIGTALMMFAYPVSMETLNRGRTLGALALGLRVVRDDGGAIRFRQALIRGLTFWIVDFAFWTGLCAGLICAATNPQSKRIGDLAAGTMVIRMRSPRRPTPLPGVPPELASWAAQLELSGLNDELVTASRQLVQRSPGLLEHPRRHLANELARQVAARTAPPPPPGLEPLDFLAAVVAERRRRESEKLIVHQQWVPTAAELPQGWR